MFDLLLGVHQWFGWTGFLDTKSFHVPARAVLATLLVIFAAAFLQRISGFGFSLFATPLLALAMSYTQAVVVLALTAFPNFVLNWREFGKYVDRPQVRRITLWAIPAMPIGLLAQTLPNQWLGGLVSVCIIAAAFVLTLQVTIPATRIRLAEAITGFVSGLLNTSTGTNGPPLVVLFTAQRLEPNRTRGSLTFIFGVSGVVALALFQYKHLITGQSLVLALVGVPSTILGRLAAAPLANRLSSEHFRRIAIVLLVAMGTIGIARAIW